MKITQGFLGEQLTVRDRNLPVDGNYCITERVIKPAKLVKKLFAKRFQLVNSDGLMPNFFLIQIAKTQF